MKWIEWSFKFQSKSFRINKKICWNRFALQIHFLQFSPSQEIAFFKIVPKLVQMIIFKKQRHVRWSRSYQPLAAARSRFQLQQQHGMYNKQLLFGNCHISRQTLGSIQISSIGCNATAESKDVSRCHSVTRFGGFSKLLVTWFLGVFKRPLCPPWLTNNR